MRKSLIALLSLSLLCGCATSLKKHDSKRKTASEAAASATQITCELHLVKLDSHHEASYDFKIGEAQISLTQKNKALINGQGAGLPFKALIASDGKGFGYRVTQDSHVIVSQPMVDLGVGSGLNFTLYREIDRSTFKKNGINNIFFHCFE